MKNCLAVSIFYCVVCLLNTQKINTHAIPETTINNNFENDLNDLINQWLHQLDAFDSIVAAYKNHNDKTSLDARLDSDYANRFLQLKQELQDYYVQLKTQSLESKTLPSLEENLVGVKFLELLRDKYNDLMASDRKDITLSEPLFSNETKDVSIREFDVMLVEYKKFNDKFKNEVKEHPREWQILNPITAIFGTIEDQENHDSEVKSAIERFGQLRTEYNSKTKKQNEILDKIMEEYEKRRLEKTNNR